MTEQSWLLPVDAKPVDSTTPCQKALSKLNGPVPYRRSDTSNTVESRTSAAYSRSASGSTAVPSDSSQSLYGDGSPCSFSRVDASWEVCSLEDERNYQEGVKEDHAAPTQISQPREDARVPLPGCVADCYVVEVTNTCEGDGASRPEKHATFAEEAPELVGITSAEYLSPSSISSPCYAGMFSRLYSPCGNQNRPPARRLSLTSNQSNSSSRSTGSLRPIQSLDASSNPNIWCLPSETLILLDWDDTICPTTWFRESEANLPEIQKEGLPALQDAAEGFLRQAAENGHVAIITMATKIWFNRSLALLPRLAEVIKELKIESISARESLPKRFLRSAFSDDRDPSQYLKTKAMENVIKRFYKKGGTMGRIVDVVKPRSWKNIVSIGDSRAERLALQDLVFRRHQRGRKGDWKECRCKTLLLMQSPTLETLTQQLHIMTRSLSTLVYHDGDTHWNMEAGGHENGGIQLNLDEEALALGCEEEQRISI